MSTFFEDGYRDGQQGIEPSPPAPRKVNGLITNVYLAEYMDGWIAGDEELSETIKCGFVI